MVRVYCDGCVYWEEPPNREAQPGECRRRNPLSFYIGQDDDGDAIVRTMWPDAWADDWCGEGERKSADYVS